MLHLEFNSDSENEGIARIVTAAYIMKFDPDMEEMDDIKTAVSEAVTNCIVHAYHDPDGKISMDLSDQNGILRIEIKDQVSEFQMSRKRWNRCLQQNQKKKGLEWDFLLWKHLWIK